MNGIETWAFFASLAVIAFAVDWLVRDFRAWDDDRTKQIREAKHQARMTHPSNVFLLHKRGS